jgi:uncharacterized protein with HEPN domain
MSPGRRHVRKDDYLDHIHFHINLDVVWDTVESSLPELARQIAEIRRKPPSST